MKDVVVLNGTAEIDSSKYEKPHLIIPKDIMIPASIIGMISNKQATYDFIEKYSKTEVSFLLGRISATEDIRIHGAVDDELISVCAKFSGTKKQKKTASKKADIKKSIKQDEPQEVTMN